MFIKDRLVRALDQTVEVIGDQRVERATTEHLAGGRGVDDSPFDLGKRGAFARLRFFPFVTTVNHLAHVVATRMPRPAGPQMLAETPPIRPRHPTIKGITD